MGTGKKLAIGVVSVVPLAGLVLAAYGLVEDQPAALYAGLAVSGIVDAGLAVIFLPHVHDNPRIGKDWKLLWIVLLGVPYITVAPLYWLIYMVPEKPRPAAPQEATPGGAWYADPWGQAPFRWWDGRRWTDWVTGPPAGEAGPTGRSAPPG